MRDLVALFLGVMIASPLLAQDDSADVEWPEEYYDSYDKSTYYDDIEFQDVLGDDYYELPGDALNADRLQYARIVTRNLLGLIGNSYNSKKRALDQSWSNGEIDGPQREAILSTLNETADALRYEVRGSGYEDMLLEELLVFAQSTMAATDSSFDSIDDYENYGVAEGYDDDSSDYSADNSLADAIENCSPYSEEFEHELTGDTLMRHVEPAADGCRYRETMPAKFQMVCLWSESAQLVEIADYYRNAELYANAEVSSQTEFVDGQPITRTSYTIDGEPWRNPMQESVESGQCQVGKQ